MSNNIRTLNFWIKMKTLLKIIAGITLMLAIGVMAFPFIFPLRFPQPTGQFGVGTKTDYLQFPHQQETHSPRADEPRELMIQFWYPTENKVYKATTPWAPDFISCLKKETFLYRFFGINQIFTSAQLNTPLVQNHEPFPVLLYSHGLGLGIRDDNSALCEELASHGYIVVGISHPYASYVVRFPDGREVLNAINTGNLPYKERQKLATQEITIWVADTQNVIDHLEKLNTQEHNNIFFNKLDLKNIGVFGHSFGGATAAQLCRRDHRCKAGIDMDGKLYGPEPTAPFHKPFMFLLASESLGDSNPLSDEEIIKHYQTKENYDESCRMHVQAFDELAQAIGKDSYKIVVTGAGHGAFSDFALLKYHSIISRFLDLGTGIINGYRAHTIMSAYVLEFFNQYLKNKVQALLNQKESIYSEVVIQKWK